MTSLRLWTLGAGLVLGQAAFAQDCVAPTRAEQLVGAVENAEAAYTRLDTERFRASAAYVRPILACLAELISPAAAAAVHRHLALSAYLADDLDAARASFRASLVIDPGTALPAELAPPGNPLAALYQEAARLGGGDLQQVYPEAGLRLWVDGAPTNTLPADRPAIVQLLGAGEQVRLTTLHPAGAALPIGLSATPGRQASAPPALPLPSPPAPPQDKEPRPGLTRALFASAGASLLVAGGFYGWSAATRHQYTTPGQVSDEELPGLIRANHAAVIAAGGLGALGLGLGLVGVWTVRW